MRITGGSLKNLKLEAPQGIRPTQDSIRLAIFNILGDRVEGANFIDLFAGSGAVGMEALSRGAEKVTFVEYSNKSTEIIKKNLKGCSYYSEKVNIINKDVFKIQLEQLITNPLDGVRDAGTNTPSYPATLGNPQPQITIFFADPPYNKKYVSRLMDSLAPAVENILILIEHSKHEELPESYKEMFKDYNFGDTVLSLKLGNKK